MTSQSTVTDKVGAAFNFGVGVCFPNIGINMTSLHERQTCQWIAVFVSSSLNTSTSASILATPG